MPPLRPARIRHPRRPDRTRHAMLKVLLAYRSPEGLSDDPRLAALPPGFTMLAAAVRSAGAEPVVANLSRLTFKDVERFLSELAPDVLLSWAGPANRRESGRLLRLARKLRPEALLLATGPLVDQIRALLLQRWREADALLPGEAEVTLARVLEAFGESGTAGLAAVEGLLLRAQTVAPTPAPPSELDDLPEPRSDLVFAGVEPERDLRRLVASRPRGTAGEPQEPARRSSRSLAREMSALRARFGLVDFSLLGPGLVADRQRLAALAAKLREAKVGASWECEAQVQDLLADPEEPGDRRLLRHALRDAAAAGCRRVRLRLTAGRAPLIELRQQLASASEATRAAGILPVLSAGVGASGLEEAGEIDELRSVVRALRPITVDLESLPPSPPSEDEAPELRAAWLDLEEAELSEEARARLDRVAEALEPTVREVLRGARPGPRELEARRVRGGGGVWLELDWADYRAANGDLEEAARHCREAARTEPWSAHPWLRLARVEARRDESAEADALREVLHRVPEHRAARERLEELKGRRPRGRRPQRRSRRP